MTDDSTAAPTARRPDSLFDLDGRVAVVTGGAGFLGRQHTEAIRAFGGKVVVADLEVTGIAEADDLLPVETDITSEASVASLVERTLARFGRIDILVNNASMTVRGGLSNAGYFAPFEEYPVELWSRALDVNLTGLFLVTQAVGREMKKRGSGVVVNMASDLALISPDQRIYAGQSFNTPVSYSVCKTAIVGFTKYLATYWAKDGIRVNALAPAGMFDGHSEEFVERLANLIPLGRMAAKNEYQGSLIYLISDASSFMTGSTLVVDGGRTAW